MLFVFVSDILSGSFKVLLVEELKSHNYIIPRPRRKNKREMPEMQVKKREIIDWLNR